MLFHVIYHFVNKHKKKRKRVKLHKQCSLENDIEGFYIARAQFEIRMMIVATNNAH